MQRQSLGPSGTTRGLTEATMDQTTGKFHQALDLLQENTTPLWPDFTPAQPRFFVFDGQATWLHECPPSPDGWQHQAGSLDVSGFGMSVQSSTGVFLGATGSWLWENFSHSVLQSLRPHGWRKCLVEGTQTVPGQLEVRCNSRERGKPAPPLGWRSRRAN